METFHCKNCIPKYSWNTVDGWFFHFKQLDPYENLCPFTFLKYLTGFNVRLLWVWHIWLTCWESSSARSRRFFKAAVEYKVMQCALGRIMRRGAQENQENQEYKAMQCALGAMRFSRRGQMRVMREAKKLLCYFYALNNLKYPGIPKNTPKQPKHF